MSLILILERAFLLKPPQRALSDEKTKKKKNNKPLCSHLSSACAFLSLFFRDVSTLFLHFFNHKVCQSLSLHTMQSIPSTVVVEVRKFSLSFSLSFKLSFKLLSSKAFCFVSRALLPSPASFFLWKVALRDDDFCDSIFGYLFGSIPRETFRGVVLFTLISLSYARIPASNVCE